MGSDNFSSTVDLLKGYNVNLYVGEEIIKGKLMGVESDHIIIEDEKEYVYYYSIDKIQAITKNTKDFKGEEITTEFMKTQSLADLLSSLKNSWVSILCLNKQSFTGVLSIVDSDFVTLINGEDRILIKISHISNILKGYRKEEKQEEENKNETESAVSESKAEDTDNKYVETQVFMKADNQESDVQQVVNLVEVDVITAPKATADQPENEKKVWAEPIKSTSTVIKVSDDIKKEEKKQIIHNDSIPQIVNSKWSRTEIPQTQQGEVKKQKSEVVIQNIVQHDKASVLRPAPPSVEKRAQVKQTVREQMKAVPVPKKEVTANSTQELLNKVKKVKETIDTNPLMKIDKSKMSTVESKKEEIKPKAQEVGASRFSGEPAKRDFDRRSIFSGWPNRNNSLRRI